VIFTRKLLAGFARKLTLWWGLFWTFLPIVALVPVIVIVVRLVQKPIVRRTHQHMDRQVQHMERVEAKLEAIVKALEKKN
jgi:uncharacterized membrane protein